MVNSFNPVSVVLSFGWCNLYLLVYYFGSELFIILSLYLSVFIYPFIYQAIPYHSRFSLEFSY